MYEFYFRIPIKLLFLDWKAGYMSEHFITDIKLKSILIKLYRATGIYVSILKIIGEGDNSCDRKEDDD